MKIRAVLPILTQIGDMVSLSDLQGRILYANPAFERITGYPFAELEGRPNSVLKSDRHEFAFYRELWETLMAGRTFDSLFANRRRNGTIYFEHKTITPIRLEGADQGQHITHFVAIGREITRHVEERDRLWQLAHHDALTGLPNRTLFLDRLECALVKARRDGNRGALLYLDLNGFKWVNDHWGHAAGDELLNQVARRLRSCLRESDTVARIGGDEFVVIVEQLGNPCGCDCDCDSIVRKLQASFAAPFELSTGIKISMGVSIGVSCFASLPTDAVSLLAQADKDMYRMKKALNPECPLGRGQEPKKTVL